MSSSPTSILALKVKEDIHSSESGLAWRAAKRPAHFHSQTPLHQRFSRQLPVPPRLEVTPTLKPAFIGEDPEYHLFANLLLQRRESLANSQPMASKYLFPALLTVRLL